MSDLDLKRCEVASAQTTLRQRAIELRDARAALANLKRAAPKDGAAQLEAAETRVNIAAEAHQAAAAALHGFVAELGPLIKRGLPDTPEAEIAQLETNRPIVLLPVRIETRFAGAQLLVRVYPDDIFADTHEPELTDVEVEDGKKFWRAAWADEASERTAWRVLVDELGAPRATWVASKTEPTNLDGRPGAAPVFPAVPRRETAWTRAARAGLLPDRWIVTLYRSGKTHTVTSRIVREPLSLTLSPDPNEPRANLGDDSLQIDDAARWTVDFEAAVAAGMALRIDLDADERTGIDRLIVVGVKSSLPPTQVPSAFAALLDNHRHGRGVSFVAQGTPTNNTATTAAPFPVPDADGSESFLARRGIQALDGRDGGRLMRALGLPAAAASRWSGADRRSEEGARAMARALYPATLGYFLEHMMEPVIDSNSIALAQEFFVDHVRGRGPLAAFRIGNTPYGVLPVSALSSWSAGKTGSALDRQLPELLRRLLPIWNAAVPRVPRVGRTPSNPDADLLGMLGMDASTREVRLRSVLGEDLQWNFFGFMGWPGGWEVMQDRGQELAQRIFDRIGYPEWRPRIGRANFADHALPVDLKLVTEGAVGEQSALTPNYIEWIGAASVPQLFAQSVPASWTHPPRALLYKLLRHASLLEYCDASSELLVQHGIAQESWRRERELVGVQDGEPTPTRVQQLNMPIPQLSGDQPVHVFLADPVHSPLLRKLLPQQQLVGLRDALAVLAPLSTAELERLFTETLDVVSHRIDAWITALADRRLNQMRDAVPEGVHLGAYGWVENLSPRAAGTPVPLGNGVVAHRQGDNGGFVQAPSLLHASTAAVLRNAYLSRSGTAREQFAVDLSSARVRAGRFILDAVREGQPLGAVLGYQVERGLHDRREDTAIDALRRAFPLVGGKSNDPVDAAESQEQIAARNVVDGLLLRTAQRESRLTAASLGLAEGSSAWAAVRAEVALLDASVDAVADLLLAESVYQLVKGSPGNAAATLDAMAQGKVRPPDPEIATMPRRGTSLTHRVAVLLGERAVALPAGWPAAVAPRAELEPYVDAWLGEQFGDATLIECRVELGPVAAPVAATTVSLDLLNLSPSDFFALASSFSQDSGAAHAGASELDRRVRDAAYTKTNQIAEVETRISYARPAAGFDPVRQRTFADLLELCRAIQEVLRHSRPLTPGDLTSEDRGGDAAAVDLMPADALARATLACGRLRTALDAVDAELPGARATAADAPFDLAPLRARLRELALAGVPGSYPLTSLGNDANLRPPLIAQAESMVDDGRRRLKQALDKIADAALAAHAYDAVYQVKAATEAAALALGTATPFLPRFKLRPAGAGVPAPTEAELTNALTQTSDAAFIAPTVAAREKEISRFEVVAARVRPALDAWRRLELAGGLLGVPRAARAVAQLPYEAGARWAALPFANQRARPRGGRVSILLHRVAAPATRTPWCGLMVDQWVEQIPQPTEQTGITFHYDDPGAEAPQTILLAVPPTQATHWDLASLLAILNETLDLAKVRAVDGELLGQLGQILPAIYMADSPDPVTVTTAFVETLRGEATILRVSE